MVSLDLVGERGSRDSSREYASWELQLELLVPFVLFF